jgi:hypothetical protein
MLTACTHKRREIIARREGIDYERCLDCDQVIEADDMEADSPAEDDEQNDTTQ